MVTRGLVPSQAWFLGLLCLVGLERLLELWLARRNARRAFAQGAVEVGASHYRVMVAMHALFLPAIALEVLAGGAPFWRGWSVAFLALALGAQALRYWCIATLGERWNTRIIVLPAVAPVTRGPYRFLRHPNYVAVVTELFCLPLVHGAWRTAVLFTLANAALLTVRIRAEEQALGPRYRQLFSQRPRFLPELRRDASQP